MTVAFEDMNVDMTDILSIQFVVFSTVFVAIAISQLRVCC